MTSGSTLANLKKEIPGGHAKLRVISVIEKYQIMTVEKTGINRTGIYGMATIFGLCFAISPVTGQTLMTFKGHCGQYYTSLAHIRKERGGELDFYQFRAGQSVASIGAQCCHWEAAYAALCDSLFFYLQDIDSSYLNPRQAGFAWRYYDSLRGQPMSSRYTLVLGREDATGLPDTSCDKILIINSFHEFVNRVSMLADIRGKLKKNGLLYIDEAVPRKKGQLHGVCKKPMLLPEEMDILLEANGFQQTGHLDIGFRKGKTFRRIYAFRRKQEP